LRLNEPNAITGSPPMKCPNGRSVSMRSQMILSMASIGVASTAPTTPHIQYQKITPIVTSTGFTVNRAASSIGVTVSPSAKWIRK